MSRDLGFSPSSGPPAPDLSSSCTLYYLHFDAAAAAVFAPSKITQVCESDLLHVCAARHTCVYIGVCNTVLLSLLSLKDSENDAEGQARGFHKRRERETLISSALSLSLLLCHNIFVRGNNSLARAGQTR